MVSLCVLPLVKKDVFRNRPACTEANNLLISKPSSPTGFGGVSRSRSTWRIAMNTPVRLSRWELVWIVPLSLALSVSITSAFGLAIYALK